jgi:REP element-mobilizing transposase RayT
LSKIVVKYFDKKTETHYITTKDLSFYEDLFYLFDKIEVKNGKIIFTHKKTSLGEIATAKYERPIEIEITEMESNHIH